METPTGSNSAWLRGTQAGQAVVIMAFMIVVLIGGVGLAIDAGVGYVQNTGAEKAAAAAALSGVVFMPYRFSPCCGGDDATDRALLEAARNGFADNCPIPCTTSVVPSQDPGSSNRLRVTIRRQVGTFFMQMFGIPSFTVTQQALASLLPPLTIGQPGGQLGSADSELGNDPHFYYLRMEGWTTSRGQGDAYTPSPTGCPDACGGATGSTDVHQISYDNIVNGLHRDYGVATTPAGFWSLGDRGGYNFRIHINPGKHVQIQVYNAAFGPAYDGNNPSPPAFTHCDNRPPDGSGNLGGPAAWCNQNAGNYHMHETDGSFNPDTWNQYGTMMYSVFQMNNEYVRTTDSPVQQTQVKPLDARPRWAGGAWNGTPRYQDPRNPGTYMTQTFDGANQPIDMQTYHWWIDIMNYTDPVYADATKCKWPTVGDHACAYPGGGSFFTGAPSTGSSYRMRIDMMDLNGNIWGGGCCSGAAHKGTAIRLWDVDAGTVCAAGCALGALGDLAIFTPFQVVGNSDFVIKIFQLPPDYKGRTIQLFVFDPGDIDPNGGVLNMGVTDPTVCPPGDCLANLPVWQADRTGCDRLPPFNCYPMMVQSFEFGPGQVKVFAATAGNYRYDNYWLRFTLPIPSTYNPDPLDSSKWWWGLDYITSNSTTSQDTITIAIAALGSPAHLCDPQTSAC